MAHPPVGCWKGEVTYPKLLDHTPDLAIYVFTDGESHSYLFKEICVQCMSFRLMRGEGQNDGLNGLWRFRSVAFSSSCLVISVLSSTLTSGHGKD